MTKCISCRKRFFAGGYRWQSEKIHKEWNGQLVCNECAIELSSQQLKEDLKKNANTPYKEWKSCFNCGLSSKNTLLTKSVEKQDLTDWGFGYISGEGTIEHEYSDKWNCSKFGFDITHKYELAETCSSYITKADYEKKCLSGEMDKEKQAIQIMLDFSSLKDVMSKGGIVMTAYNCPKCNGMVDIPENGKVLICKFCGTQIKPVDIFEKIKSLIQ